MIVWGKNDYIFPADAAHPYKKDLKNLEFHLIDTGHFALDEDGELIADYIGNFMSTNDNDIRSYGDNYNNENAGEYHLQ